MDALTQIFENIPTDGTPAEYVRWFADALAALFNVVKELVKQFTESEDAAADGE